MKCWRKSCAKSDSLLLWRRDCIFTWKSELWSL